METYNFEEEASPWVSGFFPEFLIGRSCDCLVKKTPPDFLGGPSCTIVLVARELTREE